MAVIGIVQIPASAWTPTLVSGWALTDPAPIESHPDDNNIKVARFDDTTEEGIGTKLVILAGAVSVDIEIWCGAITDPGGTHNEVLNAYEQQQDASGGPGTWSAAVPLDTMVIPTNKDLVAYTTTKTLAALGWVAGKQHGIVLGRDQPSNLVGDLALSMVQITFKDV